MLKRRREYRKAYLQVNIQLYNFDGELGNVKLWFGVSFQSVVKGHKEGFFVIVGILININW